MMQEVGFGNFKLVANAVASHSDDNGLSLSERYGLIDEIVYALAEITANNNVEFDEDSFRDVALGN